MHAAALRMLSSAATVVWVSLDTLHARGSRRAEPMMASPRTATAGPPVMSPRRRRVRRYDDGP
jgi:hypothetical protein